MNNLLLLGAEYNLPKRFKREPWNNRSIKVTGVRVFWSTPKRSSAWAKDLPFKVKMFHRIHSMVDHDMIGGESDSWQTAWRRLQSHMPQFVCQMENY